jgi:choline dehydrogenase-like flavoprotein
VARYRFAVHPSALASSDALAKLGAQMMQAGGATAHGLRSDVMSDRTYPMLQAGTTRMGKDPKHSVLDVSGEAHDVKNLYVADGSSFPSVGGAPFTLTIMANALRIGAEIVKRGAAQEL